jgi:prolyl-tRNA synthetase
MGGHGGHEFMLEAPAGEDVLLICPNGDYAANREVATTRLPIPDEAPLAVEEVATPDSTTIDAVANYLGVGTERTLKAVFYEAEGRFVFVTIRGDRQVHEDKLAALLGTTVLRPASEEQIRAAGAVPGYASPVGVEDAIVVADESARTPNLVGGANREGYHLRNVNLGRDYRADYIADIGMVQAGDPCPVCGAPLVATRGIEVGNIFKLGTVYSAPMRALYLDEQGQEHPFVMGSYGLGITRVLAAIAEHHHDERGLRWPIGVAPCDVHLIVLGADLAARSRAEDAYVEFQASGLDVLFDDRDETAGVKFADADLLGIPFRVTVSTRSLAAGGVEVKRRDDAPGEARVMPLDEAVTRIVDELRSALAELRVAASAAEARGLAGTD